MELQCKLVKETVSKDAFGEMISQSGTTPNEWRYEGEQYDAGSGLYDLRARWMAPGVGRFTSRDTFSGTLTDPISLHPYLYTENDPINKTDPSGYDSLSQDHGNFLTIIKRIYANEALGVFQLLNQLNSDGRLFALLLTHELSPYNLANKKPYSLSDLNEAMKAMVACVYNREKYPLQFEATGSSVSDIIHADNHGITQFRGFGGITSPGVYRKFHEVISDVEHGHYISYVDQILTISFFSQNGYQVFPDPFLSQGGTYGWKALGSLSPGRNFKLLKTLVGTTFYTLKKSLDALPRYMPTSSNNNILLSNV
jgi:RHS repeat-associated protein